MKRLIRKADYYDEHGFLSNKDAGQELKDKLIESAKSYCSQFGIDQSTVEIEEGSNTTVTFGNIEVDGFQVNVSVYNDKEINRIIISAGKNSKGKSNYIETRDQAILDQFLYMTSDFANWVQSSLDKLESRF